MTLKSFSQYSIVFVEFDFDELDDNELEYLQSLLTNTLTVDRVISLIPLFEERQPFDRFHFIEALVLPTSADGRKFYLYNKVDENGDLVKGYEWSCHLDVGLKRVDDLMLCRSKTLITFCKDKVMEIRNDMLVRTSYALNADYHTRIAEILNADPIIPSLPIIAFEALDNKIKRACIRTGYADEYEGPDEFTTMVLRGDEF